jgi:predicted cupin superfamily sugar epimerase
LTADEVCKLLKLLPLGEEGGRFRQTHKSPLRVRTEQGLDRSGGTAIFYLLTADDFSGFHRVKHDEIFHFYSGQSVELVQIVDSAVERTVLGTRLEAGETPQAVVPAGTWQGLRLMGDKGWALLGATVSPGYEWEDFTLGLRQDLLKEFPVLHETIRRFTRA